MLIGGGQQATMMKIAVSRVRYKEHLEEIWRAIP